MFFAWCHFLGGLDFSKRTGGAAYGMPRNWLTVAVADGREVVVPMILPESITAVDPSLVPHKVARRRLGRREAGGQIALPLRWLSSCSGVFEDETSRRIRGEREERRLRQRRQLTALEEGIYTRHKAPWRFPLTRSCSFPQKYQILISAPYLVRLKSRAMGMISKAGSQVQLSRGLCESNEHNAVKQVP